MEKHKSTVDNLDMQKFIDYMNAITIHEREQEVEKGTHIRVKVNSTYLHFNKTWLLDKGRAAGTPLFKMILGTKEGMTGGAELHIEKSLEPGIDTLVEWLEAGDKHWEGKIFEEKEKVMALEGSASYFGLLQLQQDIDSEKSRIASKHKLFNVNECLQ